MNSTNSGFSTTISSEVSMIIMSAISIGLPIGAAWNYISLRKFPKNSATTVGVVVNMVEVESIQEDNDGWMVRRILHSPAVRFQTDSDATCQIWH